MPESRPKGHTTEGMGGEVATWADVEAAVSKLDGAEQISATAWSAEIGIPERDRTQKILVMFEMLEPFFELVVVKSAFAATGILDAKDALTRFGGVKIGSLGYFPRFDDAGNEMDEGVVSLTTTLPLKLLDLSASTVLDRDLSADGWFQVFLRVFAQAADELELQVLPYDMF